MDEAVKKQLSEIIDEINAAYNTNFDVDVASKSALQMSDILLKNGHLRDLSLIHISHGHHPPV